MTFLGHKRIDQLLTWTVQVSDPSTGAASDADSAPTWRLYEEETGTPILTGTMALLDDANTVGLYSEQVTLSTANGFELGKMYTIRIAATVDTVDAATIRTFGVEDDVASVVDELSGKTRRGTAQAGAATTITLDAAASAEDDFYNGALIMILDGTGDTVSVPERTRRITDYVGSTKVATVDAAWAANPASDTVFLIIGAT